MSIAASLWANFSQAHLIAAALALIVVRARSPLWKIAICYLSIMFCAFVILGLKLNADEVGSLWYSTALLFDAAIIATMSVFNHPAAKYIATTSACACVMHVLAGLAYHLPQVFLIFWYGHKVVLPIIELAQISCIFVFAIPAFRCLDATEKEGRVTWQAKTSKPLSP
jgi:hypothetical protein